MNKIYEYVRAGKLMTSSFSRPTANECVQCGAKIASGRLCHRCSTEGVRRLYTGERYRRR